MFSPAFGLPQITREGGRMGAFDEHEGHDPKLEEEALKADKKSDDKPKADDKQEAKPEPKPTPPPADPKK